MRRPLLRWRLVVWRSNPGNHRGLSLQEKRAPGVPNRDAGKRSHTRCDKDGWDLVTRCGIIGTCERLEMIRRLLLLSLVSLGVVSGCAARRSARTFPMRIGLLADSQITSPHGTPGCLYRNISLDKRIECAIRPPALEHFCAEMLAIALRRFPADIDVILYLGDGANSGGEDEIERFFEVLSAFRAERGVPIFVVIGNHDYLGAGNTPNLIERFLIVNRLSPGEDPPLSGPYNRPLSKYEVLKRISAFNRQSSALPAAAALEYSDNAESLDAEADHKSGLYLAGYLTCAKPDEPTVEVFLADTSDYADTWFKPEVRIWDPFVPGWDIYGMQGSISSNDDAAETGRDAVSQITYLKERAAATPAEFRIIASHYHPDNCDRKRGDVPESWRFEFVNLLHGMWEAVFTVCFGHRYTNQQLKEWLADGAGNYWVSGHTHRTTMMHPGQGKVHVGGILELLTDASFRSVNVGSTTDYRAHIGIIEPFDKQTAGNDDHVGKIDDHVQYREIPLVDARAPQERQRLGLLLDCIEAYGRAHQDVEHCIAYQEARQLGLSLLGLNKDYQDDAWTAGATDASRERLDRFLEAFVSEHPDIDRADAVRSLAFIASACEADTCQGKHGFDLAACSLK